MSGTLDELLEDLEQILTTQRILKCLCEDDFSEDDDASDRTMLNEVRKCYLNDAKDRMTNLITLL